MDNDLGLPIESYDPMANSWSIPAISGVFTPRAGLTTASVNNKIYAIGGYYKSTTNGYSNYVDAVEAYDPASKVGLHRR